MMADDADEPGTNLIRTSRTQDGWLDRAFESLHLSGCAIVEDVLSPTACEQTSEAMYEVQARIRADVGDERLQRAGEVGVLRLMLAYDRHFFSFLQIPELLAVVDATVSE